MNAVDVGSDNARTTIERINQAWLAGRLRELQRYLHPDLVMVFPGFAGRVTGANEFIAGFKDFIQHATVDSFENSEWDVHETSATAVVTFHFEMRYSRAGRTYLSSGRDLWVLTRTEDGWKAMWRTMLDLRDEISPEIAGRDP